MEEGNKERNPTREEIQLKEGDPKQGNLHSNPVPKAPKRNDCINNQPPSPSPKKNKKKQLTSNI